MGISKLLPLAGRRREAPEGAPSTTELRSAVPLPRWGRS